jgi:Haspin like kinase domain
MDRKQRHGVKVYGKKAFVPGAAAAAVIFAGESPPLNATSSSIKGSPVRCALEDVTKSLSNFRLDDRKQRAGKEGKEEPKVKSRKIEQEIETRCPEQAVDVAKVSTRSTRTCAKETGDLRRMWLEPLTKEYERSGVHQMTIRKWTDILDEEWGLEKIAESSYAEVYKVSNCDGTSVLKVMALKPPTGPGSQRETSVDVMSVVSEVLIMDMMAEIPGFLEFKGAHIIEGRPPRAIRGAYDAHAAKSESFFPKPSSYHKDQLFLALELGDAGTDIEHFTITTISQIWDIFFGIIIALSHGEELASFEVSASSCDHPIISNSASAPRPS